MSFDPERYAAGIRKLNAAERLRIEGRLERAHEEAGRLAAAIIATDPAVRRVILFGSVANLSPRSTDFDIDLALDGGGDIHAAKDLTENSDFRVDLVARARVPDAMRQTILDKGIVVGER